MKSQQQIIEERLALIKTLAETIAEPAAAEFKAHQLPNMELDTLQFFLHKDQVDVYLPTSGWQQLSTENLYEVWSREKYRPSRIDNDIVFIHELLKTWKEMYLKYSELSELATLIEKYKR